MKVKNFLDKCPKNRGRDGGDRTRDWGTTSPRVTTTLRRPTGAASKDRTYDLSLTKGMHCHCAIAAT